MKSEYFPGACGDLNPMHGDTLILILQSLRGRRLSMADPRQLAIREEPTNRPDGDPPPVALFARRFPQMPLLEWPGQHIHFHQLPVVCDVAHPRPLPLHQPGPAIPATDQNGMAGGVRNHEPVQVRPAAKRIPDIP